MLTTWNAFPALGSLFAGVPFDIRDSFSFDMRSTDDRVVLSCDLPGVKPEDVELTLENGVLTVKGERKYPGDRASKFERAITLPDEVNADAIAANLSDGVLEIVMPKLPKAQPKKIAIGGGVGDEKQLSEKTS